MLANNKKSWELNEGENSIFAFEFTFFSANLNDMSQEGAFQRGKNGKLPSYFLSAILTSFSTERRNFLTEGR